MTNGNDSARKRATDNDRGIKEHGANQVHPRVQPTNYRWYPALKNGLERLAALLLLIPAGPIILMAAIAVKLSSKGPAFYTQVRIGKDGKPFTIYKLRTMIHKCESLTGARWCVPGDPRVTRVGTFLRVTHLDELPQLFNVLLGHMGLIGPRPERPEFFPELEEQLPSYRQRLHVRPGVTGLAQIQLPADTDLNSVERKLAYDLYYIQQLSPWMDLKILFGTCFYTFGATFRFLRWLCRLPNESHVRAKMRPFLNRKAQEDRPFRRAA